LCERLRVPNDCRDLALLTAKFHGVAHRAFELRPDTLLKLLQETDALRQPQRYESFLRACAADARGRGGQQQSDYPQAEYLHQALQAALAVDAGAVARQCADPAAIKDQVHLARLSALKDWRKKLSAKLIP
jgi:tRNA nucleotidyltransferase (CCA-adding enzyme)